LHNEACNIIFGPCAWIWTMTMTTNGGTSIHASHH
jgi:hypothetical protein